MAPAIPDRWLNYTPIGQPIEGTRFVAFKVPLREVVNRSVEVDKRLDNNILLEKLPNLGLIIDLTNTKRYYDPTIFTNVGVQHLKILVPGHITPPKHLTKLFNDAVSKFLSENYNNDKLIGVHCAHGVNRTGFFICHYMITEQRMKSVDAIEKFKIARGHHIERGNYLRALHALSAEMNASQLQNELNCNKVGDNSCDQQRATAVARREPSSLQDNWRTPSSHGYTSKFRPCNDNWRHGNSNQTNSDSNRNWRAQDTSGEASQTTSSKFLTYSDRSSDRTNSFDRKRGVQYRTRQNEPSSALGNNPMRHPEQNIITSTRTERNRDRSEHPNHNSRDTYHRQRQNHTEERNRRTGSLNDDKRSKQLANSADDTNNRRDQYHQRASSSYNRSGADHVPRDVNGTHFNNHRVNRFHSGNDERDPKYLKSMHNGEVSDGMAGITNQGGLNVGNTDFGTMPPGQCNLNCTAHIEEAFKSNERDIEGAFFGENLANSLFCADGQGVQTMAANYGTYIGTESNTGMAMPHQHNNLNQVVNNPAMEQPFGRSAAVLLGLPPTQTNRRSNRKYHWSNNHQNLPAKSWQKQ